MGRPKGSKDLKPRKKRVDKPTKKKVARPKAKVRKAKARTKMLPINPIHTTTDKDVKNWTKHGRVKRDDNWYNDEYDNWLINVWVVGILTILAFLGTMGLIIFNFM